VPEQTFCMIKPDATARGLAEEIETRIEKSGLKIKKKRAITMSREQAEMLYAVHTGKSFYDGLVKFILSGPVTVMLVEGEDAVARLRGLMGVTDPRKAPVGTIRGDLKEEDIYTAEGVMKNLIHGSDSRENAGYESSIFF
jgi:nucleoside-diphosphate kinase